MFTPRFSRRQVGHSLLVGTCCLLLLVLPGTTSASAASDAGNQEVERLACGQDLTRTDENGTLYLRFQCLPDRGVVNWDFRLSLAVRAIITAR